MDQDLLLNETLASATDAVASAGLFTSLCTVQQATNTADGVGQVDLTGAGFTALSGCTNIPCMRAPWSMARILATQQAGTTLTEALNVFHVLLNGYYPQIPEALARNGRLIAIIDGVRHEVLGVEPSSQRTTANTMRLGVRQVAV